MAQSPHQSVPVEIASSTSIDAAIAKLMPLPHAVDSPSLRKAAWLSIISDPLAGVAIISSAGHTIWLNDQMAKIVHGDDATSEQHAKAEWASVYPPEWIEERLSLMKQIRETGKPLLLRTIWRGHQQLSWMHSIPSDDPGSIEYFLVITRRIGTASEKQLASMSAGTTLIESKLASLGELAALTSRELEVLAFLGQGLSIKEIAAALHRSAKTIENHRSSIGRKLKLDDRVQLAELAQRAGLMPRDAERKRI